MLTSPVLTNINSKSKIFFAESPVHFNFQNQNADASIQSVTVELYLWRGNQIDVPTTPTHVFNNIKKISLQDNYIALEFKEQIKSFIINSNLNKNNPQYAYNTTDKATTAGEGVYFHIVYKVDAESDKQLGTYFATTGYRYDFEQKGGAYTTYKDVGTSRKYAVGINYDRFTINLGTTISNSTSGVGGMVTQTIVNPSKREKQTGVPCLIAYINRLGLWDTFTPFGKFVETIENKRDQYTSSFRNPLNVNSQIQHHQQMGLAKSIRKFQINTGLLDETNNYQIEEMMQSAKMYLVIFDGSTFITTNLGITVDSTIVTADNTAITVDIDTVTESNLGFFSNSVQIPVKNTNTNFLRKTRLNDKSSISYTIELESTNNYINNIQ